MSKTSTAPALEIFRKHMRRSANANAELDVSGMISVACFQEWLSSKSAPQGVEEEARRFHRALTNHLSGVDGRTPFEPEEEEAILRLLRERKLWPCMPPALRELGTRYRSKGFHEKARLAHPAAPAPAAASATAPAAPRLGLLPNQLAAFPYQSGEGSFYLPLPLHPPPLLTASDHFDHLLLALSTSDAAYVRQLSNSVFRNFVSASPSHHYTLQDWKAVQDIIRYMVIAKSTAYAQSRQDTLSHSRTAARALCHQLSQADHARFVIVMNQTGKTYGERFLAENQRSIDLFGGQVEDCYQMPAQPDELLPTMLCVGAAVHQPGRPFTVIQRCATAMDQLGHVAWFETTYLVDEASGFLAVYGTLFVAPANSEGAPRPLDVAAEIPSFQLAAQDADMSQ